MSDEGQNPTIALIVKRFKHAAIALHYGYEDEDNALQLAGIDGLNRAIEHLDAFGTEARSALIPLLEDSDQVVRALAARDLIKVRPERALAILRTCIKPVRCKRASSHPPYSKDTNVGS